jgi:glycosyltransferase involved in cell wall biosynthesis
MTEQPLRFCMITTFYPPYGFGGDAVFVHRLSNELARRGHEVDVIHCRDAYRALARAEPAGGYADHPNVTVHGLESPFGFLSPLATQQTGFPLFKSARIRQILAKGFDVIHYHNISLVGGPRILSWGQGIKLYTMHEYWLVCPTHVLFRFNRAACRRRYCFACTLSYGRPPQWWRYLGLLAASVKHVDAFIAPSRFTRDIHRRLGVDRPIVHIPLFAPGEDRAPTTTEPAPAREPALPYFLFVGRLERLKGVDTLIPAFRHYDKAQLWIAGTGTDEARLRQLADGAANIRFLGHRDRAQLELLYRHAVALIIPSRCYESFPLVLTEAFQQQTPVIVRNMGAMPEIVAESGGGLPYSSEAELVAAMDQLLGDQSRRRELGRRGYEAYRQKWTPEAHLERYLALIRELAVARSARDGRGGAPGGARAERRTAVSRREWYARRTLDTLRYEGLPILLWRTFSRCLSPLGTLQPWTFYQWDLTRPIGERPARAGISVALAAESDIDQLEALVAQRYGPTDIGPYAKLGIRPTIVHRLRQGLRCFVARMGAEIVHYNWIAFRPEESLGDSAAFIVLGGSEAYCSDAFTVEAWRGKGIHTAVLNQMLLFLQQTGYRKVYTDVGSDNKSSWKTHERLGWEVCGTALDFRRRGARTLWRWRLRGSLSPFTPKPGTFLSLSAPPGSGGTRQ